MAAGKRQALTAAVGAALRAYQRAVDAFDDAAAATLGIARSDLRCLDVLLERRSTTPGELADALGLTSGSVTAMLDRLETLGYLRRAPVAADRRRVDVRPTPAALRAVGKLWGPLAGEGGRLMGHYSTAELEVLMDVLRRARELQETHTRRIRRLGQAGTKPGPAPASPRSPGRQAPARR